MAETSEKMRKSSKHPTKKWEVTLAEFENHIGKKYKVTRMLSELSVAETKVFSSKKKAKRQFEEWLK